MGSDAADKEAITMLVGGVINGAMGAVGTWLLSPEIKKDSSCSLSCYSLMLTAGINVTAQLTAQMMGELILHKGSEWAPTVIDTLVGSATITGGALAVGLTCGGLGLCCSTMFSSSPHSSVNSDLLSNLVAASHDVENPAHH